jgi:hypothetical protein
MVPELVVGGLVSRSLYAMVRMAVAIVKRATEIPNSAQAALGKLRGRGLTVVTVEQNAKLAMRFAG